MALQLNTNFAGHSPGPLNVAALAPNWKIHSNPDDRNDLYVIGVGPEGSFLRFTLPATGDSSGYRTELNTLADPSGFTSHYDNGEEFFMSMTLRVVEVGEDGARGEAAICQVHQVVPNTTALSPPLVIFFRNGCWCARMHYSYVASPTTTAQLLSRIYNLGPMRLGQIETFVIRYVVQSVTPGTVEIWRNGVKHVSQADLPTRLDLSAPNFLYLKCGLYAYPWSGAGGGPLGSKHASEMFSFKVGTTYADVA